MLGYLSLYLLTSLSYFYVLVSLCYFLGSLFNYIFQVANFLFGRSCMPVLPIHQY